MILTTFIYLLLTSSCCVITMGASQHQVWFVTGVAGKTTDLNCSLNPRTPGDKPKLILWYKNGVRSPLFSYDGREKEDPKGLNTSEGVLNVRGSLATVTLEQTDLSHAGLYECRVDYFRSPSRNSFINVTVIEPPRSVEVMDSRLGPPKNGVLGPYEEGVTVVLICLARYGFPLPNVTWWRGDKLVDGGWEVSGPQLVRNDLVVSRLSRDWHNSAVTCKAANTHLVSPVIVSVTIEMYLLPTSVIISKPVASLENHLVRVRCSSRGSLPPASLTWMHKGVSIPAEKENTVYGSVTSSTLLLNVSREDNGSKITCKATNPAVAGSSVTNTTILCVHYPPKIKASLGRSLKAWRLKEGDDVYFTCAVDANPPATSVTWYHEDEEEVENVSEGVILSGNSLVVQHLNRGKAGNYHCRASNSLGSASSNSVAISIRYAPECQASHTTYFIYDNPINVTCTVASYPPVMRIGWQWNNSFEVIFSKPVAQNYDLYTSQLTVEPDSENEDRSLTCSAANEVGAQVKPCSFSIKVAKAPLPLSSCRLANITDSSLSVACKKPDSMFSTTTFYRAEVYLKNETLLVNVTSNSPIFNVSSLNAGTNYQIKVYVTHGLITSPPVVVSAYTSRSLRTRLGATRETRTSNVGGVVGGMIVTFSATLSVMWMKHYCKRKCLGNMKRETQSSMEDSNPDVVPNIGSAGKSDESIYPMTGVIVQPVSQEQEQHQECEIQATGLLQKQRTIVCSEEDSQSMKFIRSLKKACYTHDGHRTSVYRSTDKLKDSEESMV